MHYNMGRKLNDIMLIKRDDTENGCMTIKKPSFSNISRGQIDQGETDLIYSFVENISF